MSSYHPYAQEMIIRRQEGGQWLFYSLARKPSDAIPTPIWRLPRALHSRIKWKRLHRREYSHQMLTTAYKRMVVLSTCMHHLKPLVTDCLCQLGGIHACDPQCPVIRRSDNNLHCRSQALQLGARVGRGLQQTLDRWRLLIVRDQAKAAIRSPCHNPSRALAQSLHEPQ
jgi:hypothetical protein